MAKQAAVLGVYLLDSTRGDTRVGSLTRDADGIVAFTVGEAYLQDADRPMLSLSFFDPTSEAGTRERLAARSQKISSGGYLPPWFSGLLPEGALRDLVLSEMGQGDHDQFDVLTRLGGNLPGAILITPETGVSASAGPLDLTEVRGFRAAAPTGVVKFSLAGIQLKFSANLDADKLTVPGRGDTGHCIIKVGSERYPGLPEVEFAAMELAHSIGVNTAPCRLMPKSAVEGVPEELLAHGDHVLVVERFDRGPEGRRIHIEDAGQILGAVGERKYTMGTTETIINMVNRFSTDRREDLSEAIRRVVADVLLGNGDNHLKNWSFRFPEPGTVRLSPAYDIVPTVLFMPSDGMALPFVRTRDFAKVDMHRFERVASFLRVDPAVILREVVQAIDQALETWPQMAPGLLGKERGAKLLDRLETLQLVAEARSYTKA